MSSNDHDIIKNLKVVESFSTHVLDEAETNLPFLNVELVVPQTKFRLVHWQTIKGREWLKVKKRVIFLKCQTGFG